MKLGIIGAMNEEISFFLEAMKDIKEEKKGLITFYNGTWYEREVVICKCGVGKVNAAMTSQMLIDSFQVDGIVFTGVAGAIHEDLNVMDVVISTSCQQHDLDASPLGFERGTIPMYDGPSDFLADVNLANIAFTSAEEVLSPPLKVHRGKVVSGDQFIADKKLVMELKELFGAACVEMEGAALAQVAHFNSLPYVVIRSISDKANGEAAESFDSFVVLAARTSAQIVERIVKNI